jgi:hypothetical protein
LHSKGGEFATQAGFRKERGKITQNNVIIKRIPEDEHENTEVIVRNICESLNVQGLMLLHILSA